MPVICSTAQQAVRFGTDFGWEGEGFYPPSGGLQVCRLVYLLLPYKVINVTGMGQGLIWKC